MNCKKIEFLQDAQATKSINLLKASYELVLEW